MKKKKKKKWPNEYRLTYKLPRDYTWSHKFCVAFSDEEALNAFYEMFEHLRSRFGKSDSPLKAPKFRKTEKYNRFSDSWELVEFEQN